MNINTPTCRMKTMRLLLMTVLRYSIYSETVLNPDPGPDFYTLLYVIQAGRFLKADPVVVRQGSLTHSP